MSSGQQRQRQCQGALHIILKLGFFGGINLCYWWKNQIPALEQLARFLGAEVGWDGSAPAVRAWGAHLALHAQSPDGHLCPAANQLQTSGCRMLSFYTVLVFKINLSLDWAQDLYWIQWLSVG